jgi:hypothetical protein
VAAGGVSVFPKSAGEKRAMRRQHFAALRRIGQMDKRKFPAAGLGPGLDASAAPARSGWPSLKSAHGGYVFRMDFI